MLQAALTYYQGFLDDRRDDPTIGAELDKARNRVSEILGELAAEDEFFRVLFRLRPLLYEKSVQQELQLTPEQLARVGERPRDPRPRGPGVFEEMSRLTREQRREKYAREAESMLTDLLTPAQSQRLRQISRQLRGVEAFRDSDVVDALKLTREQRESIREISSQYFGELRRHGGGPRQDSLAAADVLQQYAVGNIMDKLTLPQIEVWKSLVGEPFAGSVGGREGGFGPPQRRGPEPR
jgi:hypothetical protein